MQARDEFQDENISPQQPSAKPARSAPAPVDTASTYSPFSNPLAQRPETRTSAGFLALWAMKRTDAGSNKAESNSGSSGAVSLAPAVEDCASSIKPSVESAASPMAAKAWGTIVESNNTSWLSGSPGQVRPRGPLPPSFPPSLPVSVLPCALPSCLRKAHICGRAIGDLQEEEHQGPHDGASSRSAAASSLAFSFWPSTTTPSSASNKTPGTPPKQLSYYDAPPSSFLPLFSSVCPSTT